MKGTKRNIIRIEMDKDEQVRFLIGGDKTKLAEMLYTMIETNSLVKEVVLTASLNYSKNTDPVQHYKDKIWQIQRFHHNEVKIDINFSPHYGVPLWAAQLTIRVPDSNNVCTYITVHTQGINLWKRLKRIYEALDNHYGEFKHVYGKSPIKIKKVI